MKKSKKTKNKNQNQKPFFEYSAIRTFKRIFKYPITQKGVNPLVKTVISNFFTIQQKQKFKITNIPVVHVDHKLDELIPFTPKKVKIYLDFIWFIARSMDMLFFKIEEQKAVDALAGFETFFSDLYKEAGSIYSKILTTTERPKYFGTPRFVLIHAFDPHLLCVPSLHVSIVAGTYAFIRKILNSCDINEYEKENLLKESYFGAVKITESVLFVKQHSINCVAGALYMLTAAHSEGFWTEEDANNFVDSLFKDSNEIFPSDVLEIQNYIKATYKKLLENRKKSQPWQKPLLDWLKNYKG